MTRPLTDCGGGLCTDVGSQCDGCAEESYAPPCPACLAARCADCEGARYCSCSDDWHEQNTLDNAWRDDHARP